MARRSERIRRRTQPATPGLRPAAYTLHGGGYVCESEATQATSSYGLAADSRRAKYNHAVHALVEDSSPAPGATVSTPLKERAALPLSLPNGLAKKQAVDDSSLNGVPPRAIHLLAGLVLLGVAVLYALSAARGAQPLWSLPPPPGFNAPPITPSLRLLVHRTRRVASSAVGFAFGGAWRMRAGQITREEWAQVLQPALLEEARRIARQEAASMRTFEAHRERYAADKGLPPDYALASSGGAILWTKPALIEQRALYAAAWVRALFTEVAPPPLPRKPSAVLSPAVAPGSCWCFYATNGMATVVVRVARPVVVTAVSIEHTPATSAYHTGSAPKQVNVSVLPRGGTATRDRDAYRPLGSALFNPSDGHLQSFDMEPNDVVAKAVAFDIISNHGAKTTCIYRLRVHGDPVE